MISKLAIMIPVHFRIFLNLLMMVVFGLLNVRIFEIVRSCNMSTKS